MLTKRFIVLSGFTILLCVITLGYLATQATAISTNGRVCNHSSLSIWLTVTESTGRSAYELRPGSCTDVHTQDAEAIWGRDCRADPCRYQAWKVGAGRFDVFDQSDSPSGPVLRIRGWGAGSRWHMTREWNRPDLSAINYSLSR